ncbi:hypothetical protein [Gluconobacter kondonii]|uniref:hypothetical protein n=1 Tax=Gluconobacter kondonii TaxID=941463 RepID=UPI001B8D3229|nr:hypothetical protein [Gluconobacter kondonii]
MFRSVCQRDAAKGDADFGRAAFAEIGLGEDGSCQKSSGDCGQDGVFRNAGNIQYSERTRRREADWVAK